MTGVVLADGSPTSHAAILARGRDIPVIVSAGHDVLELAEGTTVVVDGSTGELHVRRRRTLLEEYRRRAREAAERNARQLALAEQPAMSRDGTAFTVAANLGSVADARAALVAGADGAGLVRTEFIFLDRSDAPTVEEQQAVYDEIAEAMGGRRVTLRTPRRRRRQAAVVPADARRGQPVPRTARHPAEPRAPRPPARPAGRHVRDRAPVPDRHHVPDGDHAR